jgi:hypothetical protein
MSSDFTVHPETLAGDGFYAAATQRPNQDRPHGCYDGVVYVGYMVEDENGEEVEVFDARLCRRCHASEAL